MGKKILITGATGKVASALPARLVQKGHHVRVLIHSEAKAAALRDAGAEVVVGAFEREDTLRAAFAGVDTAFLVVPPSPDAAKWNRSLFAAAKSSGSPHVVRLSVVKAALDAPTDNTKLHGESDGDLERSGLPFTILRPHFFMQNLFGSVGSLAKEGAFYMATGSGRLGMIDARDIADAAFVVLDAADARERHGGKRYDLTGPASITLADVASILGKVTGKPIKYVDLPPEAVVQFIKGTGAGDWFANVMGQYSRAYAANWGDFVTGDVKALTGHEPRSFETFAREVLVPAIGAARG